MGKIGHKKKVKGSPPKKEEKKETINKPKDSVQSQMFWYRTLPAYVFSSLILWLFISLFSRIYLMHVIVLALVAFFGASISSLLIKETNFWIILLLGFFSPLLFLFILLFRDYAKFMEYASSSYPVLGLKSFLFAGFAGIGYLLVKRVIRKERYQNIFKRPSWDVFVPPTVIRFAVKVLEKTWGESK